MNKIILLTLLCLGFLADISFVHGQTLKKNDQGESVIVYPDGSWRFFDANNSEDQMLMQKYLEDLERQKTTSNQPKEFDLEATNPSLVTNELERYIFAAQEEERKAITQHQAAWDTKLMLEEKLKRSKKDELVTRVQIKELKDQLAIASKNEQYYAKAKANASKKARQYEKIALMPSEQQQAALEKIELEKSAANLENISTTPDVDTALAKAEKKKKKQKKVKSKRTSKKKTSKPANNRNKKQQVKKQKTKVKKDRVNKKRKQVTTSVTKPKKQPKSTSKTTPSFGKTTDNFKQLTDAENVILNPPTPDCKIAFEGIEEFSGKKRKDVAPAHFFSFTNENLRSLFKDKDMITCSGHVTSVSGGLKFLSIEVKIRDENAQRNYGMLEKGSLFSIRLVNGTTIQLVNKKSNPGILNRFEKSVTYNAQYRIGPDQEKLLRKVEIDQVRIVWSSGYEDYEIYETDFLIHQLDCLSK